MHGFLGGPVTVPQNPALCSDVPEGVTLCNSATVTVCDSETEQQLPVRHAVEVEPADWRHNAGLP